MASFLMGIDYGTGGCKAAIIDSEGAVVGYAFEEYAILTPKPGWSEHDPVVYWEAARRIIAATLAQSKVTPPDIAGIAVSSALPSMVMVDSAGNPVHNAYNLLDRRAQPQVEEVTKRIGEETVFAITKNRLDDHPALINLLWEKQNRPESFARIAKVLTIDGYITMKLTGKAVLHYSGAAFFGVAYDLLNRSFNQDILHTIGISSDLFPALHTCTDIIGEVTPAAARETGLACATPVAAGQVDCNAGWSGAGALNDGDLQMNLGTCGNFGIIHTAPVFHQSMIACNYTTDTPENPVYITIPTTTTGGGLIRYLRDTFYTAEKKAAEANGTDPYDAITSEAEKVPPGSQGLVVLPFLMGERTPLWDANARGAIIGLSLNHSRGHVARAMMESVAYALYHSFSTIIASGQEVRGPIVLNEGGAKSPLWRSIITDVFNVPTVMVKNRAGAPYGDAICAGVATGLFSDFSVACQWTEHVDRMEPDAENHANYLAYFDLYKKMYLQLKETFAELAVVRG